MDRIARLFEPRTSRWVGAVAAIGSAVALSICCVGPLVLLALGVTGVHFIEAIEPYRPFLIAAELAAYLFYKRATAREECEEGRVCATGPWRVAEQVVFWGALLVAVGGIVAMSW